MSSKIKVGDRVTVITGVHRGKVGTIETRRSTAWVVVFADRTAAQLPSGSLRKAVTL